MHDDHAALESRMLHRMLFFTDAVFAIVLTLLVLELKPPETWREANVETLRHLAPHIGAFAFSFLIGGVFWSAHMTTMRRLAHWDWPTALANLLFLLPISLLPFVTGWLGADLQGAVTWALYSSVLVAISACNVLVVLLAYRDGGRLVAGGVTPLERRLRVTRAAAPGSAFLLALLLLAAGQTILAHFCWLLIPIIMRGSTILLKPKPAKVEPEVAA
jgi:uncharacterized membrane protein